MSKKTEDKIQNMTIEQLKSILLKEREDISKVSIEIAAKKFRNTNLVKNKKRKVAQILTEIHRRELIEK